MEKERARVENEKEIAREDSIHGYRLVGTYIPKNKRERDSIYAQIAKEDSVRGWRLIYGDIPVNKKERDSLYRQLDSIQVIRDSFWKDKEFVLPSSPDFETIFNFCRNNFPGISDCYYEIRMRILEKEGIQVKRRRPRTE